MAYSGMLSNQRDEIFPPFQHDYMIFLLNRPELAVHYLKELLRHRNEPGASSSTNRRFAQAISGVDTTLRIMLLNINEGRDDRTVKNWARWLRAGLCALCEEALHSPDFFMVDSAQDLPAWQVNILVILAVIFSQTSSLDLPSQESQKPIIPLDLPPDEVARIMDEVHAARDVMWTGFWKRHTIFKAQGAIHDTKRYFSQVRETGGLLRLFRSELYMHWAIARCDEFPVAPSTAWLRKIAVLLWIYSEDDDDQTGEPRWALLPKIFAPYKASYELNEVIDRPGMMAFVHDEVLPHQTAEAFFSGVRSSLGNRHLWGILLADVLAVISILVTSSSMLCLACISSRVFSAIPLALYRHEHHVKEQLGIKVVLQRTMNIFCTLLHTSVPNVKADLDTVHLLLDCKFFDILSRVVVVNLDAISSVEWAITTVTDVQNIMHALRSRELSRYPSLLQSLSMTWYRTLKSIREAAVLRPADQALFTLAKEWQELGVKSGLKERVEKRAYDEAKQLAQMCAWSMCEWHTAVPPTPTRLCVGCGEARYCSKPCQVKDWKQGGHKAKCRRLKAPVSTGRYEI
ncbi:hypothetical protein PENSPDRAFT_655014 [Peniophora sp. CONT]|nr:hypothetical protein PENSPDRAFT_655014 [Peniophora sp. CONT]